MPTFRYKAVDDMGKAARGLMEAANDADLELRLRHMGLDMITFALTDRRPGLFRANSVSMQELIMFCMQLEQLMRAGVPTLESLMDLRDGTGNSHLREVICALISEVEGGKRLSEALTSHPEAFSHVFVSLIRAGEQSGRLPEVLDNLAMTLKWQDEMVTQGRRLLAYPLLVLVVMASAFGFLMMYLVPQMVTFLRNLGQEPPLTTRILIAVSEFVVNYWWLVLSLPFIITLATCLLIRHSPQAAYRYDYLKLHLPVLGEILQKTIMARIARYFALMYQTGIPVLDAINTCKDIASNRVVADALERARQQINAGSSMRESFQHAGLFPPLVVRMIRVGESTGALDKSLLNISYFYDREVRTSVQKNLTVLGPALTVILGMLLAMIMLSVLGPVYDTLSNLKL